MVDVHQKGPTAPRARSSKGVRGREAIEAGVLWPACGFGACTLFAHQLVS